MNLFSCFVPGWKSTVKSVHRLTGRRRRAGSVIAQFKIFTHFLLLLVLLLLLLLLLLPPQPPLLLLLLLLLVVLYVSFCFTGLCLSKLLILPIKETELPSILLLFLLFLLFVIILKHYCAVWTFAYITILVHSFWSLATACRFLTPIVFVSSSTLSVYAFRGLSLFLIFPFWEWQFFLAFFRRYSSVQYVHIVLKISDFINFAMPAPGNISRIFLFAHILQFPLSFMGH